MFAVWFTHGRVSLADGEDPTVKLSPDSFRRAEEFIHRFARPLEVARFAYHFRSGPPGAVVDALAPFQNPDGGFGHGLEPDWPAAGSSALCTSIALQIAREVGAKPDHPLVVDAVGYFLATRDAATACWSIIPAGAETCAHAPWWAADGLGERFGGFALNPTAEILGHLADLGGPEAARVVKEAVRGVTGRLRGAESVEMHDLLCCTRLAESRGLDYEVREAVVCEVRRLALATVSCDPSSWSGYVLRPLDVAHRADSPLAPGLSRFVPANLDWLVEQQQPDGSWRASWSWGHIDANAWAVADAAWAGVLTLEALRRLRDWGWSEAP